ncbi:MAG: DUF1972 domain-containing protein [Clostridiales bacterium]|nr:DUF1972 domain-containing protein [Clostridiales bacterium]
MVEINGEQMPELERHRTNPGYRTDKKQVFIVGCKGIPAAYGGFETFAENLTKRKKSENIRYHVARMAKDNARYEYNHAKCFNVRIPDLGSAKAILYDIAALRRCIQYCRVRPSVQHPVFYVLACRVGPFIRHLKRQIRKLDGILLVNPDGHEWQRGKWSRPVRAYWKFSEKKMVKSADLLICDNRNIERYIQEEYKEYRPQTLFIPYGSDVQLSASSDEDGRFQNWMRENHLSPGSYYLAVGRFVPENNYEIMIREFMKSDSPRSFVLITTIDRDFSGLLEKRLHFSEDARIRFVHPVYDSDLLKKIRENAYGYFHGHEVGGTNPGLLEALGSTSLNLLLDVCFNREVGADAALYWDKREGNLASLIEEADRLPEERRADLGRKARARIAEAYNWEDIVDSYEKLFLSL